MGTEEHVRKREWTDFEAICYAETCAIASAKPNKANNRLKATTSKTKKIMGKIN